MLVGNEIEQRLFAFLLRTPRALHPQTRTLARFGFVARTSGDFDSKEIFPADQVRTNIDHAESALFLVHLLAVDEQIEIKWTGCDQTSFRWHIGQQNHLAEIEIGRVGLSTTLV